MKGIAHFVSGVAIATFFPQVVQQGAAGGVLPVLGGIGGILPDTLDFKFARYFERYDDEVDPDPTAPDPQEIAGRVAAAIRAAYETGKPRNIMLHTMRMGADLWRQYSVRFNPEASEVIVRIGPLVNTGQVPLAGSEPEQAEARVQVGVPMVHTYDAENKIDIFSGPSFAFERRGDAVHVHFLDWHRRWSHSLTVAALGGLLVGAIAGLLGGWSLGLWAGLCFGLGFAGHVLEDQLGHMGSNLFWPFTKTRMPGLHLLRSGDSIPNFLTVWTSLAVILFNLDRFSAKPLLPLVPYLLVALVLPWAVLVGLYVRQRFQSKPEDEETLREKDMVAEGEEVDLA
jgi:membrane-bound metal-dependent hydrolase YbcI (DUF457 family)